MTSSMSSIPITSASRVRWKTGAPGSSNIIGTQRPPRLSTRSIFSFSQVEGDKGEAICAPILEPCLFAIINHALLTVFTCGQAHCLAGHIQVLEGPIVMRAVLLFPRSVIIAVVGMVVLGCAVYFGIDATVNRAVSADAEHKARGWAAYFIEHMPNLDRIDSHRQPRRQPAGAHRHGRESRRRLPLQAVRPARRHDAGFRRSRFTSRKRLDGEHSAKAADVLRTGISNVSLNDGTGKKNRPPLYVEAYVPIVDGHGERPRCRRGLYRPDPDGLVVQDHFRGTRHRPGARRGLDLRPADDGLPPAQQAGQRSQAARGVSGSLRADDRPAEPRQLHRETGSSLRRKESGKSLAIVFLDVDDFKAINDTHGHEAGDEFLKHVAHCITRPVPRDDIVARPGGDEFMLALTGRSEPEVVELVERLMREVGEPIVIRGKSISGKLSAGIYMVDRDADEMADAMHKADVALYQAKDRRPEYLSPVFRGHGEQHAGPPRAGAIDPRDGRAGKLRAALPAAAARRQRRLRRLRGAAASAGRAGRLCSAGDLHSGDRGDGTDQRGRQMGDRGGDAHGGDLAVAPLRLGQSFGQAVRGRRRWSGR